MPQPGHSVSRRKFLRITTTAAAALSTQSGWSALAQTPHARLTFGSKASNKPVPEDFVGLSYENMQLEDPSFFSAANRSLVEEFRKITPHGVLRLGGNTSEFSWWKANATDVEPKRAESPWKSTGEPTSATTFAITPEAIDNLDGFLRATGWSCIYGLNLGYGSAEQDLPEAKYVFQKLGPRLAYFQIGNEVDLFKRHLRDPATWNVDTYLKEWLPIAQAVQAALPGAKFGLPDVASDVKWLPAIADRWSAISNKPHVVSMSHHYYWSGPPSNPKATIANLLKGDPGVSVDAAMARSASEKLGPAVQWRMTEGNTIYRGGKWGLSDVFASALWSADYLLKLASLGYAGVNLHGGSGHAQAVSVGGTFVGESSMPDPTVPHPKPFYTPIANEGTLAGAGVDGKLSSKYVLEPVAYGMEFAAAFAGARMLPVTLDAGGINATAYAAVRPDGKTIVAIINKDANKLTLDGTPLVVQRVLTAPEIDSHEAALLDGSHMFPGSDSNITVPPHTAVLAIRKG